MFDFSLRYYLTENELDQMNNEYSDLWRDENNKCRHKNKQQCYKMTEAGYKIYFEQCLFCGKSKRIKKSDLNGNCIVSFNLNLQNNYYKLRQERINKQREIIEKKYSDIALERQQKRHDSYKQYLLTPRWQEKRKKVFSRANNICEGCGINRATQVHHLTYDRLYDEMLFDLVAVCDGCHKKIHSD